jgi:hypothetical protein
MKAMKRLTKKDLTVSLYSAGRSVEEIARALSTSPSYVANVLVEAGKSPDYNDLYVSSVAQKGYAQLFRGVLQFKTLEAALESVEQIDRMFHAFERQRDRRGMHQAQLTALIGKNRAESLGKYAEAQVFAEWLMEHLVVHRAVRAREEEALPR